MSQSFLNSGTLVILCLFLTMGPQFYSLIQAIIRKMQIFKCLIQAIIQKMQIFKCLIQAIIQKMQIFKCFMSFCSHWPSILQFFDNSGSAHRSFADPYGEIIDMQRKPCENSSLAKNPPKNTTAYIVQQSNCRWHCEPTFFLGWA